jgi:hypothetical protein
VVRFDPRLCGAASLERQDDISDRFTGRVGEILQRLLLADDDSALDGDQVIGLG